MLLRLSLPYYRPEQFMLEGISGVILEFDATSQSESCFAVSEPQFPTVEKWKLRSKQFEIKN
jgi:hypothetical protein